MSNLPYDHLTLFQGLNGDQMSLVRRLFLPNREIVDTVLFEQGDIAEFLYIVVEGEVHIFYKPEDGPELTVARIRPDGVVGWSSALGRPQYTSSAVCMTDCCLLRVRGRDLRELYAKHPETGKLILERLAAVISERMRNTHQQVISLLEQGLRVDIPETYITG